MSELEQKKWKPGLRIRLEIKLGRLFESKKKKIERFEEMTFWRITEWLENPELRKRVLARAIKYRMKIFHGIVLEGKKVGDDFLPHEIESMKNGFNVVFGAWFNNVKKYYDKTNDEVAT